MRGCDHSSSPVVVNCHNRLIQLQKDLFILGIGGSCIAYEGEKEMWDAYPYSSDIDTRTLESLSKSLTNEHSVIMFTHCPPSSFASSLYRKPDSSRIIQTGSRSLASFLTGLIREVCYFTLFNLNKNIDKGSSLFAWPQSLFHLLLV